MTTPSDPDQLLQRTLTRPPGILQKALKAGLRLPMKAWRTSVDGLDRIPASGGVLIASNHGSYLDHFFLAFRIRRPVNFMAAAELFSNPVAARVLSALGAFPVRRGEHDSRSVETAAELVRSGRLVVIYPQGIWYGRVQLSDVPRIVEETLVHGRIVEDLRIPPEQLNCRGGAVPPSGNLTQLS